MAHEEESYEEIAARETGKDRVFRRNACGVALVEFFWGLGFPVIMESTFLQIFLKKVGASDFLIGMVPAIVIFGISIFPLFSAYLTRNQTHKKMIVLWLHAVSSLSVLAFGVYLFFVRDSALILPAFFLSYVIFSFCIGLTFPVWLNFLVKIFSEKKNVQGLSIMMIAQNAAKIISALFIMKIVDAYSLSVQSAAWIFFLAGCLFLCGSFCFLITREISSRREMPLLGNESFVSHTVATVGEMVKNRNLMLFLAGDIDNYVTMTAIAFYANYATQYFGVSAATASGLFVCFIYSGAIAANVILGTVNFLSLKSKFISTKILCLTMLLILVFWPALPGFLAASFLMGVCRGTRSIIYSPSIKRFGKREDVTGYFAVAPLLTGMFGSGFPVVFGKMLDHFAYLGSRAYGIMFAVSMGVVLVALAAAWATRFDNVTIGRQS